MNHEAQVDLLAAVDFGVGRACAELGDLEVGSCGAGVCTRKGGHGGKHADGCAKSNHVCG